jgi:hypothetical protein
MPTLWSVALCGPGAAVQAHQLHGLLCEWLDRPTPDRHDDHVKGFTLQGWSPVGPDVWELLVGLVDDALVPRLMLAAGAAIRTPVFVGPRRQRRAFRVEALAGAPASCVRAADFTALACSDEEPAGYRFETVSPLLVRSRTGTLTPGTVFGHLRRRWSYAPEPVRDLDCDFGRCDLEFVELDLEPVTVTVERQRHTAVTGALTIAAPGAGPGDRRWLHRLGVLATYAGLGSYTTRGLGITHYEPVATW